MRILAALLFFIAPVVYAADAPITWTAPTQYTDGTALPASAIASYDIAYGLCSADKKSIVAPATIINVPGTTLSKTITGLGSGTWCFQVRTVTTDGQTSVFTVDSATGLLAWKQIVLIPKPPGTVTVGGGTGTAYMAVRQTDKFVMVPVGTVPANTVCDAENAVIAGGATYFAVPTSAVQWFGSTRPTVALAPCS